MPLVLGVTGYTGCGKSFISKLIAEKLVMNRLSVKILDADQMARKLRDTNPTVKKEIIDLLGSDVYDAEGISIPEILAQRVFGEDKNEIRQSFEQIFLDRIPLQVIHEIETNANEVLILDFFLIFDYLGICLDKIDKIILVTCGPEIQFERLISSDRRMNPEDLRRRIAIQQHRAPLEIQIKKADWVINNDPCADLEPQLKPILHYCL